MKYIGITQRTAEWLLINKQYLDSILNEIEDIFSVKSLAEGVLAIGSLRITASSSNVICFWNNDYLTGTGNEDWGFIKTSGPLSVFEDNHTSKEAFIKSLYIINQRLQGLLLDNSRLIHQSVGDNNHLCLPNTSERNKAFCIGYYEHTIPVTNGLAHGIICIGPTDTDNQDLVKQNLNEVQSFLGPLIDASNRLLTLIKSRPVLDLPFFKGLEDRFQPQSMNNKFEELDIEEVPQLDEVSTIEEKYSTLDFTYDQWISQGSSLTKIQRYIIESEILESQPMRIIGAAGSGKSLIMQLLTLRQLIKSKNGGQPISILYVVHNSEMANTVTKKFEILGASEFLNPPNDHSSKLIIRTLFEHSWKELNLPIESIIDKDATQTKSFQRSVISDSIDEVFEKNSVKVSGTPLLAKIYSLNSVIRDVLVDLFASEISISIKGRDLIANKKKYVEAERPLSRFHGILSKEERELLFEVFESYHKKVFENLELLDSDDVAISFLAFLKTPLWQLKRKKEGFDYLFVDETQLFNQNERQLFRLLPKMINKHLPIALAIDEAQELRGSSSSGFGLLGIEDLANEILPQVHRSTPDIINLAFFVIQQTTDLFGPDFPDFTEATETIVSNSHNMAKKPLLVVRNETRSFEKTIRKEISELRKSNIRQIAVVVHSERHWNVLKEFLEGEKLPLLVNVKRGELIDPKKPIVFLTRPENIGGQEFGAVISVGLEYGVTPPIVDGHAGLSEALEQQFLRELYLVFTRAKFRLVIVNSPNSLPSVIIQSAITHKLIETDIL